MAPQPKVVQHNFPWDDMIGDDIAEPGLEDGAFVIGFQSYHGKLCKEHEFLTFFKKLQQLGSSVQDAEEKKQATPEAGNTSNLINTSSRHICCKLPAAAVSTGSILSLCCLAGQYVVIRLFKGLSRAGNPIF